LRRRREAGGDPLESRWDEAERGQAAGVRDAGTLAELEAGGLPKEANKQGGEIRLRERRKQILGFREKPAVLAPVVNRCLRKKFSGEVRMLFQIVLALVVVLPFSRFAVDAGGVPSNDAGEYSRHFGALSKLSIAVAEAMPPDQYGFRPHPESMNFGELIAHIATTNYQFCASLKDSDPPSLPSHIDKDAVVKFLSSSFEYCSAVIPNLTEGQLNKTHNSPDGNLLGREVLLALYIHVAHHRGQAEIYLRDKGIKAAVL
jgi:uncharacterized damage-inducible protein DinB